MKSELLKVRIYFSGSDGTTCFRTTIDPVILVRTAIQRNEFAKLLLGEDKYQYLPIFTSCPGRTEVDTLLAAFRSCVPEIALDKKRIILMNAIADIIDQYEGIFPIAYILCDESYKKAEGKPDGFELPLAEIASHLEKTITKFGEKLVFDNSEEGANLTHGRYDFLLRLSRICEKNCGISFAR